MLEFKLRLPSTFTEKIKTNSLENKMKKKREKKLKQRHKKRNQIIQIRTDTAKNSKHKKKMKNKIKSAQGIENNQRT